MDVKNVVMVIFRLCTPRFLRGKLRGAGHLRGPYFCWRLILLHLFVIIILLILGLLIIWLFYWLLIQTRNWVFLLFGRFLLPLLA
jgi:hypothetical protein